MGEVATLMLKCVILVMELWYALERYSIAEAHWTEKAESALLCIGNRLPQYTGR